MIVDPAIATNGRFYKKQGVYLQPEPGFVITGYRSRSILYTDGLQHADNEELRCEGQDPVDLENIRTQFYRVAQWQLERGGYEYEVDKTEFETLTTKAPTITRGENVLPVTPMPSGDDIVAPPVVTLAPITKACTCLLTTCNCFNLAISTVYTIDLPVYVTGTLNFRFHFKQPLPEVTNTEILINEDGNLALMSTAKGPLSVYVNSNQTYEMDQAIVDGEYVHVFVDCVELKSANFEAVLPLPYCDNTDCSNIKVDVRVTWDTTRRRKRSWFFGLTTTKEVQSKVNNALDLSESYINLNKQKLDTMDSLLKDTDLNLAKQAATLKSLYLQLCGVNQQSLAQNQMLQIETSIRRNVDFMMELLSDCSIGIVPHHFSYNTVLQLCMANMQREICEYLGHKARLMIKCRVVSIHLLKTKYLLDFELSIPRSFEAQYSLFKPITIPTFHTNTSFNHEVIGLAGLIVLQYTANNVTVLLDDCLEQYGMITCSGSQSHDQHAARCIAGIVNAWTNYTCETQSFLNTGTCFARKIDDGLMVSTNIPIEVHHHSAERLFNSHSTIIEGTDLLRNSPKESYSVSCNGILISTKLDDPHNITIHDHDSFSWDNTITSAVNKKMLDSIKQEQSDTRSLIGRVNASISDIHGNFKIGHLHPLGPHKYAWLGLYVVFTIVVIVICGCCCCKTWCCNLGCDACLCTSCGACAECIAKWKTVTSPVRYVPRSDPEQVLSFLPNSPTQESNLSEYLSRLPKPVNAQPAPRTRTPKKTPVNTGIYGNVNL